MYIIIIGCGRLGSNLAKILSDDGHDVCIVDRDTDRLNTLGSGFNGQRIKGIEFDSDNLIEAGIKHADALLAITSDDNINITVSLIAEKIYTIPKIFARVNDPGKVFIYNMLNIKTINPIQSEIELLKGKLLVDKYDVIASLEDDYQIIELPIQKNKSKSVESIEEKYSCIISGLIKDKTLRIPKKTDLLQKGDRIICFIKKEQKGRLINSLSKDVIL